MGAEFQILVNEFIVNVWEVRKQKLHGNDCPNSLSPHLGVWGVLLGLRDTGMVRSGKVSCDMHVEYHKNIRWTRAKRHTAESYFELVGSFQRSPAQCTLEPHGFIIIHKVFLSSCGSELMRFTPQPQRNHLGQKNTLPPRNS